MIKRKSKLLCILKEINLEFQGITRERENKMMRTNRRKYVDIMLVSAVVGERIQEVEKKI